jgi:hypothetical protein
MSIEAMRELLLYDPETGEFTWTDKAPHKVRGKKAKSKDVLGYTIIKINTKIYKAHRIAWFFHTGIWPTKDIDHINGNPSDNRIINLREVSHSINMQNRAKPNKNSSTGFLGVTKNGNNFRAEIGILGKKKVLGTYKTPEEANEVCVIAKRKLFEGKSL